MDLFSYLNSKDVAEYCRSLDYKFNAIEAAVIVNACRRISLEEKLQLFQEIIDTMPDESLSEKAGILKQYMEHEYGTDTDSFLEALSMYISVIQKVIIRFMTPEPNTVYTWQYFHLDCHLRIDADSLHSTFESAMKELILEIAKNAKDGEDVSDYTGYIWKRRIDSLDCSYAAVTGGGLLFESPIEHYKNYDHYEFFESIWIKIPVPFKKGDLLSCLDTVKEPMVLIKVFCEDLDENNPIDRKRMAWRDASDMIATGYWMSDDGRLYVNETSPYFNLEYYRGEIKGNVRVLKALSAQIKGEIDAHMLMIAYDAVLREREMNAVFPDWDYLPECYEKAGITDIHEKYELWKKYDREESEND